MSAARNPISIFLPSVYFQRSDNRSTSMAEELANAIRMHEPFRGHSIVFEIRPTHAGELAKIRGGVIYVRT